MPLHDQLSLGLVGAGAMGSKHARVVASSSAAELVAVVDADAERAGAVASTCRAAASTALEAVFDCDAAIVACTTDHHAPVALELLERGIPVLLEKPLAADLEQAEAIVEASARCGLPLMCGFVERFNAAVTTVSDLLTELPVHVVAVRHSPPALRIGTSVVHDLLIHDIDLVLGFLRGVGVELVAGAAPLDPGTGTAEVADCTLSFTGGALATLSASRCSQRKIRSLMLTTPTALFDVDLLRQDVTVYREARQNQVGDTPDYRAETVVDIPFVRHRGEPLALQFEHFVQLVRGDADPAAERATLLGAHRIAAHLVTQTARAPVGSPPVLEGAR